MPFRPNKMQIKPPWCCIFWMGLCRNMRLVTCSMPSNCKLRFVSGTSLFVNSSRHWIWVYLEESLMPQITFFFNCILLKDTTICCVLLGNLSQKTLMTPFAKLFGLKLHWRSICSRRGHNNVENIPAIECPWKLVTVILLPICLSMANCMMKAITE